MLNSLSQITWHFFFFFYIFWLQKYTFTFQIHFSLVHITGIIIIFLWLHRSSFIFCSLTCYLYFAYFEGTQICFLLLIICRKLYSDMWSHIRSRVGSHLREKSTISIIASDCESDGITSVKEESPIIQNYIWSGQMELSVWEFCLLWKVKREGLKTLFFWNHIHSLVWRNICTDSGWTLNIILSMPRSLIYIARLSAHWSGEGPPH